MKFLRIPQMPEPIALLNRVPIRDNGEAMLHLTRECKDMVIAAGGPHLRETVVRMLKQAKRLLPPAHTFLITTAYRTLEVQKHIYDFWYHSWRKMHPGWPESVLRRQTNRFTAPYDQKAPPGHCTGGAVDLTVVDEFGEELDMVSPLDRDPRSAPTYSPRISAQASANRQILIRAMWEAGFSNCAAEWWHWSWGDSAWAVRTGNSVAHYGLVEGLPYSEVQLVELDKRLKRAAQRVRQEVKQEHTYSARR